MWVSRQAGTGSPPSVICIVLISKDNLCYGRSILAPSVWWNSRSESFLQILIKPDIHFGGKSVPTPQIRFLNTLGSQAFISPSWYTDRLELMVGRLVRPTKIVILMGQKWLIGHFKSYPELEFLWSLPSSALSTIIHSLFTTHKIFHAYSINARDNYCSLTFQDGLQFAEVNQKLILQCKFTINLVPFKILTFMRPQNTDLPVTEAIDLNKKT